MQKNSSMYLTFFVLKAKLQVPVLKFEFCHI